MKQPSMPYLRNTAILILAAAAQLAHADQPSACGAEYADSLGTAQDFRTILEMCDLETDGYARALYGDILLRHDVPRLRDLLSGCDLRGMTLIDDAGHWVQYERPHAFHEALLRGLAAA